MQQVYAEVDLQSSFPSITHFTDIGSLVTVVAKNAFVIAGVIMFALLVFGGFGMIMAGGSGDTKKLEEGKKAITGAVIGLIIIVGSFWIIQIVEKLTGLILLPK
ncbi:MAG TPA: hypothetical protein VMR81_02035 [Patescibacteria group bacterium]|jgi:hypothetical protein|nr:hypothetical protein [Patescibacteria group bacterium]